VTASDEEESTRQTMHRVFDALTALVPAAIADSITVWEERPEAIRTAIDSLAAASEQLAAHGIHRDASFRFLSQSLASETRMLQRQLERGKYISAAYFTERVVETCIACHVRLPTSRPGDFERALFERVDRSALPPFARADLEMASRQFDAALQTQEAQFADPEASLDAVDLSSVLTSYLITALRVKRDPGRAAKGLALLARREDLSAQLELNLPIWQQALTQLAPALHEAPTLERAQKILDSGHALSEFPFDAANQVHAVIASSVVFRYLEEKAPEGEALAQALYLLSRTEAFTRRSFELSEAASYLEQAIHAAPHTTIAERAYARLELQTLLQFVGEQSIEMPEDIHSWLMELRELSSTKARPSTATKDVT
jgi:tetratricopeptide (TPR) repeat protein